MLMTATGSDALQQVLLLAALAATAAYLGRIVLALLLILVGRARPSARSWAVRCAPAGLRPLVRRAIVGGLLGATLTSTGAWAAPAADCGGPPAVPVLDRVEHCGESGLPDSGTVPSTSGNTPVDPGPSLDSAVDPDLAGPGLDREPARYRVAPGDSLWQISSRLLGEPAEPAAVANAWPKLWAENRRTIGDDPGLIQPGTELVVPADLTGTVAP